MSEPEEMSQPVDLLIGQGFGQSDQKSWVRRLRPRTSNIRPDGPQTEPDIDVPCAQDDPPTPSGSDTELSSSGSDTSTSSSRTSSDSSSASSSKTLVWFGHLDVRDRGSQSGNGHNAGSAAAFPADIIMMTVTG